jgi:hypothetical protein
MATTSGRVTGCPELLELELLDELELLLDELEELEELDELEELELLLELDELDELEDELGAGVVLPPPQPTSAVHRIAASGADKLAGFKRIFFI